jgi:hypothetical protein
LLQVFLYKLAQDGVAGDFSGALPAPSALGTPLSRPRTVTTRGLMGVAANLPADRRWTPSELPGNGADAPAGMQQVCDRDPFRLREEPGGDDRRPPVRDGSVLLDVSGLENDGVAVPPSGARTTADSHDPAGFGIAHSLFHQLIIMSTCSVLRRRSPGLPPPFHFCQLQLLIPQVLQRPLDAKPAKWLTFRPSLTLSYSERRRGCSVTVLRVEQADRGNSVPVRSWGNSGYPWLELGSRWGSSDCSSSGG